MTSGTKLLLVLGLFASTELAAQGRRIVRGDRFGTVEELEAALIVDLLPPGADVALMRFDSDGARDLGRVAAHLGPRARVATKQACRACSTRQVDEEDIPAGGALALFSPRVESTDSTVGFSMTLMYDRGAATHGYSRQVGGQLVARNGQWVVISIGGRINTSSRPPE